jgi:hypothetical protein
MEHVPPAMVGDKEHPQELEGGSGGHSEQVHPCQTISVAAQHRCAIHRWSVWSRGAMEVTRDSAFIDANAKPEEFPMDAERPAPQPLSRAIRPMSCRCG